MSRARTHDDPRQVASSDLTTADLTVTDFDLADLPGQGFELPGALSERPQSASDPAGSPHTGDDSLHPRNTGRALRALRPKTMASRLLAGVVSLVVILVCVVGVATYFSLRSFLHNRLEQQVNSLAANTSVLTAYIHDGASPSAMGGPLGLWLTILENDGSTTSFVRPGASSLHDLKLTTQDIAALTSAPGRDRSVITTDGDRLVVQSVGVNIDADTPFQRSAHVVVGLSAEEVNDTLRRLLRLEVLAGLAAILLAALLTSLGVRRELRPLRLVSRTAEKVTAELGPDGSGLDRRVPGPEDSSEVGRVASSMNTLLAKVQTEFAGRVESEERMRQFLADASHELRTPLTSIRGYAELARLQGRVSDPDDPMHRIEVEGTRMSRLVEDLLVLARGDQDNLTEHKPVDINVVMTEAAAISRSAYPSREIGVAPSGGVTVLGDRDQLTRLFVNLLNNACVHTDPVGPIRIGATSQPGAFGAGPAVVIQVIDSGPGLPPDQAAHVFERFWRADKARSRVKGGSGLGMAIVAQIVHGHGGQVRFESSVSAGSAVTVTLPEFEPGKISSGDARQN